MFICRLRLLLVFSVFSCLFWDQKEPTRWGSKKKTPETFVSYGFGFGSDFQTEEKKREFSFYMNIQLEFKAIFVFFIKRRKCKFQIKPDAGFCSPGKVARLTNQPTV